MRVMPAATSREPSARGAWSIRSANLAGLRALAARTWSGNRLFIIVLDALDLDSRRTAFYHRHLSLSPLRRPLQLVVVGVAVMVAGVEVVVGVAVIVAGVDVMVGLAVDVAVGTEPKPSPRLQ